MIQNSDKCMKSNLRNGYEVDGAEEDCEENSEDSEDSEDSEENSGRAFRAIQPRFRG